MPESRADLFDPAALAALGRIEVVARWVVDGFMAGLHRSPKRGFSVEFAEHRPYQPGDDLRYVDWRIVARADRWVVKQFEEETNLRAVLVLDVSRSMHWRGDAQRLTKLAYAERLVAALALLLLRQRDAVGLVRYDERLRTVLPARARMAHWRRIIATLDDPGAGLDSRADEALAHVSRLLRRPGLVTLVSDLLMDPEPILRAVRLLRAQGHDVTVLHVLDPMELDLTKGGEALYVDPESELAVPAAPADVRDAYRQTVQATIAEWRAQLGAVGAAYEPVATDVPFGIPLRRVFAARQRLP